MRTAYKLIQTKWWLEEIVVENIAMCLVINWDIQNLNTNDFIMKIYVCYVFIPLSTFQSDLSYQYLSFYII